MASIRCWGTLSRGTRVRLPSPNISQRTRPSLSIMTVVSKVSRSRADSRATIPSSISADRLLYTKVAVITIPVKMRKANDSTPPTSSRPTQPQPPRRLRLVSILAAGLIGRVGCSLYIRLNLVKDVIHRQLTAAGRYIFRLLWTCSMISTILGTRLMEIHDSPLGADPRDTTFHHNCNTRTVYTLAESVTLI